MKLFECTWQEGWEYFQRYYDTELKQSFSSRINMQHEWYEPKSNGLYESVLDPEIKLDKRQGRSKDGRDHYGFINPMYRNIRDNYWGKGAYNLNPRIFFLDIETRVGQNSNGFPSPQHALEEISLIQIFDNYNSTMYVLGSRDWVHQKDYEFDYEVKYVNCENEIKLIDTFLALFKALNPLIIYAWYGLGFDYPYIYNRMKKLGMDINKLSNYGTVTYSESEFKGKKEFSLSADGHFFLDLKDIYEKFTFEPVPSYALDTIAEKELNQKKVSHTEYALFDDFYTGKYIIPEDPTEDQLNSKIYKAAIAGDWEEVKELAHSEFVYYGCVDTNLIRLIDEKLNFTALMLMVSDKMGVQMSDATGTVKPWSCYISNKALTRNKILPPRLHHDQPNVVGGFVRESVKGLHSWILSEDVSSMYPLLGMVGFNMSPETFIPKHKLPPDLRDIVLSKFNNQVEIERFDIPDDTWKHTIELLEKYNYSLAINGGVFDRTKLGMIPEMVQDIYDSRKKAKDTMFEYEQKSVLIQKIIDERKNET